MGRTRRVGDPLAAVLKLPIPEHLLRRERMEDTTTLVDDQVELDLSTFVVRDGGIGVHLEPADGPAVRRNHWTAKRDLAPCFPGQELFSRVKHDVQLSACIN